MQAPLTTVDLQLGAVTTFHAAGKGLSQTPRFGVFGTRSVQLQNSEGLVAVAVASASQSTTDNVTQFVFALMTRFVDNGFRTAVYLK